MHQVAGSNEDYFNNVTTEGEDVMASHSSSAASAQVAVAIALQSVNT